MYTVRKNKSNIRLKDHIYTVRKNKSNIRLKDHEKKRIMKSKKK